ncbi:MAG: hypothetical protein SWQ30_18135 [Thermodesulfobacteriota bacterium]|nr:hypothetical protein [Thermodesulfobacteriota bacterium]
MNAGVLEKVVDFWGAFETITSIAPILQKKAERKTVCALFSKRKRQLHLQGAAFVKDALRVVTSLALDSASASLKRKNGKDHANKRALQKKR